MRAAVRGVIDFRQARLLDPDWWRLCYMLIHGMHKEDEQKILGHMYQFHLALVGNSGLSEDSFKKAQQNARGTFFDLVGQIRPWDHTTEDERQNKELADLRQRYIDRFGDPDSPEFKAKLQEADAYFAEQQHLRDTYVSDEDKLQRRIDERNARLAQLRKDLEDKRAQRAQRGIR